MNRKADSDEISDSDVDQIKQFYDSVYHADAHVGSHEIRGHYENLFHRLSIKGNTDVLDVACGTGEWLKVCADQGMQVAGIDLSDKAISVCRERMPEGEFHAQSAESLPFGDQQFDVVTCLGSLEHFVDPVSSLKEMVRVAKADAIFVILVPNEDFLTRKLGFFGGTYQVEAKEVARTLAEWESLFSSAGLEITERWKDLHIFNRGWIMRGRFYLWPIRLIQCLLLVIWPLKWQYQVYHRCIVEKPSATNRPGINAP